MHIRGSYVGREVWTIFWLLVDGSCLFWLCKVHIWILSSICNILCESKRLNPYIPFEWDEGLQDTFWNVSLSRPCFTMVLRIKGETRCPETSQGKQNYKIYVPLWKEESYCRRYTDLTFGTGCVPTSISQASNTRRTNGQASAVVMCDSTGGTDTISLCCIMWMFISWAKWDVSPHSMPGSTVLFLF